MQPLCKSPFTWEFSCRHEIRAGTNFISASGQRPVNLVVRSHEWGEMKLMPARVSFRFFVPARNFMPAWKCSNFVKFSMWTEFFSFRGETNSLNSISGLTIWRAKSDLDFFLSWILASLFFGFVYLNWNGWSGSPNENSWHEKTVSKIVLCLIYMLVVVLDRTILPVIISSFFFRRW